MEFLLSCREIDVKAFRKVIITTDFIFIKWVFKHNANWLPTKFFPLALK